MAQGREDLIYSLAKSMGVGDSQKSRYTASKFNLDTGVLYANGHMINKTQIEQARTYFTAQYRKMAEKDDEGSKNMATIYEIAMEAINMMVEASAKSTEES